MFIYGWPLKDESIENHSGSILDIESPGFIKFVNIELGKKWESLYDSEAIYPPELYTKYRSKLENRSNLKFLSQLKIKVVLNNWYMRHAVQTCSVYENYNSQLYDL